MQSLFEWDKDKAKTNRRKHKVTFEEAQTVFEDDFSIATPDPDHSDEEERWIIIGSSNKKHILVVAYTEREKKFRLISARKANRAERKKYEEETSD